MAIPLALPGVVTVAILAFIASWNNYILPLYVLELAASHYTLPLGVQQFSSGARRTRRGCWRSPRCP